ncbi:MAG TPA: YeeE/YedE family protein [Rhodospirillales bacterium]|nr:YeeE/YedE family protein [Rhodospirillales bacterium]
MKTLTDLQSRFRQPRIRRLSPAFGLAAAAALFLYSFSFGGRLAALVLVGLGLGAALLHASFGFTGAYRRVILDKDMTGVSAQLVMLAAGVLLFAPFLAEGSVFGRSVVGAVAPVSVSMAFGAFLFGVGMQVGGACASGTLFSVGGGSVRMVLLLFFFCLGAFWGSLDLYWWSSLPGIGPVSLGRMLGWIDATVLQLLALALIFFGLRLAGRRNKGPLWFGPEKKWSLLRGPWPLLLSAGLLALLNWATLAIAGHPWSIVWGLTLWPAKAAAALGWDPASSAFWRGGFQQRALARSVFADITSVMNIAIIIGAFIAAAFAGKASPPVRIPLKSLAAAILGGLMMGYGARLAYGCNIGSFFSGVASSSLHGWIWILFAVPGNILGVRLRPAFGLGG